MSKAIASGTARMTDNIQMTAISRATHIGTPIPLTRLHEATARYLEDPVHVQWVQELISLKVLIDFMAKKLAKKTDTNLMSVEEMLYCM